jgi:hypothetical protein
MATYRITAPDGSTYEVTAPDTASEAEVLAYAQKNYSAAQPSAPTKPKTFLSSAKEAARDLVAGGVRGAGSIGATLLAPIDAAARAVGVQNDFIGRDDRREQMDAGLRTLGADTNSFAFGAGKLGAEIAGTAGAGNVLAKPVMALANTRYAAGLEPLLEGVGRGLQTGGFRVGELAGTSAAIPARLATGGAVGAATAGLVNPSDAPAGFAIGAGLPVGAQIAGKVGERVGGVMRKGPAPTSEKLATAREAMDAGYVIPPSQVNPTFKNRLLESQSGKFETAQLASNRNQQVTDSLVRKALGMADDAPLSQEALQAFRRQQGQVYQQLKGTGTVSADQSYLSAIDDIGKTIKSATASFPKLGKTNMHGQPVDDITELVQGLKVGKFDASGAVDTISFLRDQADTAYAGGNKALGKAYKAGAKALEDMLDRHLQTIGATDLLPAYRGARQMIAKSYTVENALREGAGTVDARALARQLQKGKPLSGELLTAARFGNVFDKAAQPPHLIGSPGVNTLKNTLAMVTSGLGGAAFGPAGLALGAVNYAAPPMARSLMFSQPFQRGLLSASRPLLDETAPLGLLTLGARSAPVLTAQ